MERDEALARLAAARVGHLATADAGGSPHTTPLVFAVDGETIYWAVDDKPKRSKDLQRVRNIRSNPNVQLVVDHYDEDWAALWWVRASGSARLVQDADEVHRATELMAAKYAQYRERHPSGPVLAIDVTRLTWWEGAGPTAPAG